MINRILIRLKVIQILYSFLLVEKKFTLENQPSAPTKEKRFAYALYLDFIILLIRLAESVERRKGQRPLFDTKFISRLLHDDTIRQLRRKFESEPFPLQSVVESIANDIQESGIYKTFIKDYDKHGEETNPQLWRDLFNLVIVNNSTLRTLVAKRPNFTIKAFERATDMLNRTLINFLTSHDSLAEVEKALATSLDKARELYLRLMLLPVELTELEARIIDERAHKFLKADEDINPNMRFVDNRIIAKLSDDPRIKALSEKEGLSWMISDPLMLRNLLKDIKKSDLYVGFMFGPENDIHTDAEFWRTAFRDIILSNADFLETLEEKSVFWNDDLEIMTTFVLKSLRRLEDDNADAILEKYKDDEDARFGSELLKYLYRDRETLRLYIDDAIDSGRWDKDRLAFMDIVIIETALTEILNFPKIPIRVSINEYIELAKSYSGEKSGQFVHGVLGSIISRLRREGKLLKP